jgi:hypothetical protein
MFPAVLAKDFDMQFLSRVALFHFSYIFCDKGMVICPKRLDKVPTEYGNWAHFK